MPVSEEELLAIAHQYWRTDRLYDNDMGNSPENERFQALWRKERTRLGEWRECLSTLRQELPGFDVADNTTPCDSGFRCTVYPPSSRTRWPPEWIVAGCVSIIAPVYAVYGVRYEVSKEELRGYRSQLLLENHLPPEMREPAAAIARRLETTFGVSALPPELAARPVPLIVMHKEPPHTTLFHALLTSEPENVF